MKKRPALLVALLVVGVLGFLLLIWIMEKRGEIANYSEIKAIPVGCVIATYKSVPAYENGEDITQSHGRHYAKDGYYYGQKWQCVEYVKRFYHDALDHHMPSVWGHAKDFYDPEVAHGEINTLRGLVQYQNGGDELPQPDDLLVFSRGSLGHVAIVTKVSKTSIEVIQQNVHGSPRSVHPVSHAGGAWTVGKDNQPAGWLRLPSRTALKDFLDGDLTIAGDD